MVFCDTLPGFTLRALAERCHGRDDVVRWLAFRTFLPRNCPQGFSIIGGVIRIRLSQNIAA
jgi:hypothetical protein